MITIAQTAERQASARSQADVPPDVPPAGPPQASAPPNAWPLTDAAPRRTTARRGNGPLPQYALEAAERTPLAALAEELSADGLDPTRPAFYDRCRPAADRLSSGLRGFLAEFRRGEPAAACLIRGLPVDSAQIGPTPPHWEAAIASDAARTAELCLALCAMVLGEPFAWSTLQSGRIIQNILPIAGDERRQNGYGSEALLEFHTEDGFHPLRCDYLLLLGLRNPDGVPTIVASVRDICLPDSQRAILAEKRFYIEPDTEHIRQLELREPGSAALALVSAMQRSPEPVAVLFGNPAAPYLRIDRPFMRCATGDREAEHALDGLMAELERVQQEVVVDPGTLLIIDNYLAVHGRQPFRSRYDGTDRWLKKLTVSRNLRRGLGLASEHGHRVLL